MIARGLGSFAMDDQQLRPGGSGPACDDLVLSVLKSPVKETTNLLGTGSRSAMSGSPSAGSNGITMGGGSAQTQSPSPQGVNSGGGGGVSSSGMIGYRTLQGSEDDLVDDVESAIETTELNAGDPHKAPLHPGASSCSSSSPRALKFLRRFRPGKPARAFEPHHRRVPTPMRRKNRSRSRSRSNDILDGVSASQGNIVVDDDDDDVDIDDDVNELPGVSIGLGSGSGEAGGGSGGGGAGGGASSGGGKNLGVPNPYYPIALPIDQAFKAKYVFHHRRGKTVQERFYVFLEHPGGWLCFVYHFSV
uniref:Uncharacterized protein n=1 Tax=Anopheles maculatus TaxID=74869 RepID=A0A182T0V9_9DIPT